MATKIFPGNGSGGATGSALVPAVILSAALVISSIIVAWGLAQAKPMDQTLVVTGSATRRIVSDRVVWRAGVSFQARSLPDAYSALSDNIPKVRAYLISKGVKPDQIRLSPVESTIITERSRDGGDTGRVSGFSLKQIVEVRSDDVPRVERLSQESGDLVNEGILLEAMPSQYSYVGLADVKQAMVAEAVKDAHARAEKIAASVGTHLGPVRSVQMGAFKINAADSSQTPADGASDTSSLEKNVSGDVTITYAIR